MAGEDIIEAANKIEVAFRQINIEMDFNQRPQIDFTESIERIGQIKKQAEGVSNVEQATFLITALNGTAEHFTNMGFAFAKNKPIDGVAELSRACASLSLLIGFAGSWGGPLGIVVSEVFSLMASILVGALGQQPKSVAEQLRKELKELGGGEYSRQLAGALSKLEVHEVNLKSMDQNSKYWNEDLYDTYVTGDEGIAWFAMAYDWLIGKQFQETTVWPLVFQAYMLAVQKYFSNLVLVYGTLKKNEDPLDEKKVREGIRSAKNDIKFLCEEFEGNLAKLMPLALNHGDVYHVGTNDGLFRRAWVVGDEDWDRLGGSSWRVSVGPNKRIWTVGKGDVVWTGFGEHSNWASLKIKAQDISVAKRAGSDSLTDVYTIENGKIWWRVWDETIVAAKDKQDERFIQLPEVNDTKYDGSTNSHLVCKDVVAVTAGEAYLWGTSPASATSPHPFAMFLRDNTPPVVSRGAYDFSGPVSKEEQKLFKGISVSEQRLYTFVDSQIYYCKRDRYFNSWFYLDKKPPIDNLKYQHLYACNDGSLLATIDDKIWLWDGDKWIKNEKAKARRVFKEPVDGWDLFAALKDQIEKLREATKDKAAVTAESPAA